MSARKGFSTPNYTHTPNDLFDVHMRDMGEAELKVVLHTVRQTFGYHKKSDEISITQYQKATGLSRNSVIKGLNAAIARGVMKVTYRGKRGVKRYALVIENDQSKIYTSTSENSEPVATAGTSAKFAPTKEKKETSQNKGAAAPLEIEPIAPVVDTRPKIYTYYEQTTGNVLTKYQAEAITEACKKYGEDTVQDAMTEAARHNGRSWQYVEKILQRWEREGRFGKKQVNVDKVTPISRAFAPPEDAVPIDHGVNAFVRTPRKQEAEDGAA